ncbi:MAG: hypothetical protein K9N05_06385 [Candidatus Marinimicrobia bacterium]|nr:hypothetical protein [Candidatus Neomarinimicrobiota bacterium]
MLFGTSGMNCADWTLSWSRGWVVAADRDGRLIQARRIVEPLCGSVLMTIYSYNVNPLWG